MNFWGAVAANISANVTTDNHKNVSSYSQGAGNMVFQAAVIGIGAYA
jgi:hypothetical protein